MERDKHGWWLFKTTYIRGIKSPFEIDLTMFVLDSSFNTDRENVEGIFVVKTWHLEERWCDFKTNILQFTLQKIKIS